MRLVILHHARVYFPRVTRAILLSLTILLIGCTPQPKSGNPSFPVTVEQGEQTLEQIKKHPKPLDRPLIIVTGFMDPGFAKVSLYREFWQLTRDDRIVSIQLATVFTFDQCRDKIIRAVQDKFPSTQPSETVEVDVIGYSMGGLAARYAAMPTTQPAGRQLNIARLFTISTPHRGAAAAEGKPQWFPLPNAMMPGSPFLQQLNADAPAYPIVSYVVLGDKKIGESNAAPPDQSPWWIPNQPMSNPHMAAYSDPRILADIILRLRDEPPLTHDPQAPLPTTETNASQNEMR